MEKRGKERKIAVLGLSVLLLILAVLLIIFLTISLSKEEVKLAPIELVEEPALVLLLSMDDVSADKVYDMSNFRNNGTLYGNAVQVDGIFEGKALQFDGIDDYIEVTNFNMGESVSVSLWLKSDDYDGSSIGKIPISLNGSAYESGPNLYFTGETISWNTGNGGTNAFSNSAYPDSEWHHFVIVNDEQRNTAELYIDGSKTGNASYLDTRVNNNVVAIGRWHKDDPAYYFNGLIDEVMLFNRSLTEREIQQLFNNIEFPLCRDNDITDNIYKKGSLIFQNDVFQKENHTDVCNDETSVKEYYCADSGFDIETIDCPEKCFDGACELVQKNISLTQGINYINLPLMPFSDNIDDIIVNPTEGMQIITFNASAQVDLGTSTYEISQWNSNPILVTGQGFKFLTNNAANITFKGMPYTEAVNLDLFNGTNLIGIPYCTNNFAYNGSIVLKELNRSFANKCQAIFNYKNNSFEGFSLDESLNLSSLVNQNAVRNDFIIDKTKAYRLFCNANFAWKPSCNYTEISACQQNLSFAYTLCMQGDIKTKYYFESGTNCGGTLPANVTERCDFDNNNILGVQNDISSNRNIRLLIDYENANYSRNYNGTKFVEFSDGNVSRIEFEFNFSNANKLNLANVEITLQSSGDRLGFIAVKGLELLKTIRLNKLNASSNSVCIKDSSDAASSFSSRCNSANEKLIRCNATEISGYSCEQDNGYYVVSGLMRSAVKEYVTPAVAGGGTPGGGTPGGGQPQGSGGTPAGGGNQGGTPQGTLGNGSQGAGSEPPAGIFTDNKIIFWIVIGALIIGIIIVAVVLISILRKGKEEQAPQIMQRNATNPITPYSPYNNYPQGSQGQGR